VRQTLESGSISFDGPGGKNTMQPNHHTTKNVYIGETRANGQFKILKSFDQVYAEPFLLKGLDEKLAAMNK
jgi:urea transport system substrate-binding protein